MRINIILALLTAIAVGCAALVPVAPDAGILEVQSASNTANPNDNHRLWGEWTWFISSNHELIDVVPQRQSRLHLNALKFLESYCTDCVKITKMKNNGDGTIDVTVRITHPFPNNPEYTGFDVKGIVMFTGSHDVYWFHPYIYPLYEHFRLSWKEVGDPEILNPNGYTPRWNPAWNSGSDMPIYNYWPGKRSNGTPSANLNAFINFYTDEQRHMFRVNGKVEKTYHISLPPGPLTLGYAVEGCWEPPVKTPVTDPLNDFPYSANQPEPYYAKLTINNNEKITTEGCCGEPECSTVQFEIRQWYGPKAQFADYQPGGDCGGSSPSLLTCPYDPDPGDDQYYRGCGIAVGHCGNGKHRGVAIISRKYYDGTDTVYDRLVYIPFDYQVEL